jgi:hypothetical protein
MSMSITAQIGAFLAQQIACFDAALLAVSVLHKIWRWPESLAVVQRFGGVPAWFAPTALGLAALAESSGALLLLAAPAHWRAAGAGLAAAVWLIYFALIVISLVRGRREVDCGCSFGPGKHTLGRYQVLRNVVLIAGALLVAASPTISLDGSILTSSWLAAVALLVLYGALDQAMSLKPPRPGVTW